MNRSEQQFFNELEKKLWTAADKQRPAQDATVSPQALREQMLALAKLTDGEDRQ